MSVYNSLIVPCPRCREPVEFQTHAGPYGMHTYNLDDAPAAVIVDIAEEPAQRCDECGLAFKITIETAVRGMVVIEP